MDPAGAGGAVQPENWARGSRDKNNLVPRPLASNVVRQSETERERERAAGKIAEASRPRPPRGQYRSRIFVSGSRSSFYWRIRRSAPINIKPRSLARSRGAIAAPRPPSAAQNLLATPAKQLYKFRGEFSEKAFASHRLNAESPSWRERPLSPPGRSLG